ncbi:hypothetical protein AXK57_21865 [Tsukamurella pulmonis]|uniref:hypothetical protein n=1 Tax=Tsukamurella pulmonis TaxID=47312 RepID=UPI000792F39B|nr:hypothetical protein [Tsukamurella pulmonis]KXP11590.1 hypothetical protein AXK57_21865 [Tsukamurella pulmonis]
MNQHGRGPLLAHGLTVDVVRGADVDGRVLVDGAPGFVDEAGALVVAGAGGRTNTGIWTWIGGGPVATVTGGGVRAGGATAGGTVVGPTAGGGGDVVAADGGGPAGAAGMIGAAVLVDAPVPMVSAPTLASVVGVCAAIGSSGGVPHAAAAHVIAPAKASAITPRHRGCVGSGVFLAGRISTR